jgi:NAD(P)H-flavin reductase
MEPAPFRIREVAAELDDCFTLTLNPPGPDPSFTFAPGQFNMIYVFGHGEVPISMSGDPASPQTLVHTIRRVGPVTDALGRLKPGEAVGVRGPFGSAWPLEQAHGKNVLVLAGGLGLAPLRPAIYHLLSHAARYRSASLLYGSRSPNTLLFAAELESWAARINLAVTVDSAGPGWRGHVGVVTDLLEGRDIDPANTVALLCGPEIMMRFCARALMDMGLPATAIHVSMERNMKCALGFCGRCQYGPHFICQNGPVFSFDQVERLFKIREL